MANLNYHHLRYFREVATQPTLSQAAERLNVSQSALSVQIRQLEARIGQKLFDRVGRTLVLTEAGRIALDYAERIFQAGDEMVATLQQAGLSSRPLRVGALSTLSRNFQLQFLQPLLGQGPHGFTLKSGNTAVLLEALREQSLDVVLTTELPASGDEPIFAAQKISEQAVGLHGRPGLLGADTLAGLLVEAPIILPTDSVISAAFRNVTGQLGLQPRIAARVDDMAMVRLLAREGVGLAVAPALVLADEIESGFVKTAPFALDIVEPFYAVTVPRKFPHPALAALLADNQTQEAALAS